MPASLPMQTRVLICTARWLDTIESLFSRWPWMSIAIVLDDDSLSQLREFRLTGPSALIPADRPDFRPKTGMTRAPRCPASRFARVNRSSRRLYAPFRARGRLG